MGIEPTYPAWKAGVLPLNYTRICPKPESNQRHEDFQSSALPTELSGHLINIEVFVSFVSYSLSTIVILQQDKRKVKHFFEKNLTFF